jgi:AMP nucleosidase
LPEASAVLTRAEPAETRAFTDPAAAVAHVRALYDAETGYLREHFRRFAAGHPPAERVRAFYPYISLTTQSFARVDTRLSYGFVSAPGTYATTVTRPQLFGNYLTEQIAQLVRNHGLPVEVGISDVPIPVHFAYADGIHIEGVLDAEQIRLIRDCFDVPDLAQMDDSIVNGTWVGAPGAPRPLSLFTAPRIDYSLHRLRHYTGTSPEHFQNYVIFTNYQFYIDEFIAYGQAQMADPAGAYETFVEPGHRITRNVRLGGGTDGETPTRLPQMPGYHLVRPDASGITMINIGVGPSNAKTATDHVAVLRPFAWMMLGHCAGLRSTQKLGDYVLAHGYVRWDHVLDEDIPPWIPVPALAEVQIALEQAVGEVAGLSGWERKSILRTGTVATIDNRNWELRDHREPVQRLSQSRAIALDMESATIAANGFRFRVPYGTLLCVSDKPLHGMLKLPGMADAFYRSQVDQHLKIGILAMEKLRALGLEQLHSRKLRSFSEVAFQ